MRNVRQKGKSLEESPLPHNLRQRFLYMLKRIVYRLIIFVVLLTVTQVLIVLCVPHVLRTNRLSVLGCSELLFLILFPVAAEECWKSYVRRHYLFFAGLGTSQSMTRTLFLYENRWRIAGLMMAGAFGAVSGTTHAGILLTWNILFVADWILLTEAMLHSFRLRRTIHIAWPVIIAAYTMWIVFAVHSQFRQSTSFKSIFYIIVEKTIQVFLGSTHRCIEISTFFLICLSLLLPILNKAKRPLDTSSSVSIKYFASQNKHWNHDQKVFRHFEQLQAHPSDLVSCLILYGLTAATMYLTGKNREFNFYGGMFFIEMIIAETSLFFHYDVQMRTLFRIWGEESGHFLREMFRDSWILLAVPLSMTLIKNLLVGGSECAGLLFLFAVQGILLWNSVYFLIYPYLRGQFSGLELIVVIGLFILSFVPVIPCLLSFLFVRKGKENWEYHVENSKSE